MGTRIADRHCYPDANPDPDTDAVWNSDVDSDHYPNSDTIWNANMDSDKHSNGYRDVHTYHYSDKLAYNDGYSYANNNSESDAN
jgi:hypothetical protein